MIEINDNLGVLDKELKSRLEVLPVSTISDGIDTLNLEETYILPAGIVPLKSYEHTVVGIATTIFAPKGTSLPLHIAVCTHSSNRILVVATDQACESAYIGDIQALMASKNGCQGIIIDGYVRDAKEIVKLNLPIFCRGRMPNKPNKQELGYINKDIYIGATKISNGDIICADEDGIIVIPEKWVKQVIEAAEKKEQYDTVRRNKVDQFDYEHASSIEDYISIMTKDLQKYLKK